MRPTRRDFFAATAALAAGGVQPRRSFAIAPPGGRVEGQPGAAKVGGDILTAGGNAVDAIVAAAFTAAVIAPHMCGPGGYGGAFVAAVAGGMRVVAIDFNSTAPAAATPDMFTGANARRQTHGWLAAGVPGTLAGLHLAAAKYGTKPFADVVKPAAALARDGFRVDGSLANGIRSAKANLAKDPASAKLYLPGGEPPKAGDTLTNPDLAALLDSFARAGTVADFYRGDAAKRVAAAFKENGGLVTDADLAAYAPHEPTPAEWSRGPVGVFTPPPTAGGVTALQALMVLDHLGWGAWDAADTKSLRGRVEALRLCWADRLRFLGNPDKADVPWRELLDPARVGKQAKQVEESLRTGKPVPAATDGRPAGGTIHLSAADAKGNVAALTLTHGGGFGAQVTVPGLGVTLGHGMSRFDPRPGHPNGPGPGKRPLHNMCPTVVLRDGKAVLAAGGRGGRKIPNAVFEVLAQYLLRGATPAAAVAAPRVHTEGGMAVELERGWPEAAVRTLTEPGYTVTRAASATVSAVWADGGATR